jgi:hypothetical protein
MATTEKPLYAPERDVTEIKDCWFYHVMEMPGMGTTTGAWDLRGGVDDYLGNVKFQGKRVLEVGTASGFLCFEMEKRGAEVVGYDLSDNEMWDLVPYGGLIAESRLQGIRDMLKAMNNGWWFAHRVLKSKARVVYGDVYQIPPEIGAVHISTFGCILLHLRDPFLALQRAAALTSETIIVTDVMPNAMDGIPPEGAAELTFVPDPDDQKRRTDARWWCFTPEIISRYLKILGFRNLSISYHVQKQIPNVSYQNPISDSQPVEMPLFTVVGAR